MRRSGAILEGTWRRFDILPRLSRLLDARRFRNEGVGNAKHHEKEAEIIFPGGRPVGGNYRNEHGRPWLQDNYPG